MGFSHRAEMPSCLPVLMMEKQFASQSLKAALTGAQGVDPPAGLGAPFSTTFLLSFLPQKCSVPRGTATTASRQSDFRGKRSPLQYNQPFQGCDGTDSLTRPAGGTTGFSIDCLMVKFVLKLPASY